MGDVLLSWLTVAAAGVAVALLIYVVLPVKEAPRDGMESLRERLRVLNEEPLGLQVWQFLKACVSGRTVFRLLGALSFLEPDKVLRMLEDAEYPLGLKGVGDVYALGVAGGGVLTLNVWLVLDSNPLAVAVLPFAALVSLALVVGWVYLIGRRMRLAKVEQLETFLNGLALWLGIRPGLYQAIKDAAPMCPLLRADIERALLRWHVVKAPAALDELAQALRLEEAYPVIQVLKNGLQRDPGQLKEYMRQEAVRLGQYLRFRQEEQAEIRPIIQQMILVVPGVCAGALLIGPWAYAVLQQMQNLGI